MHVDDSSSKFNVTNTQGTAATFFSPPFKKGGRWVGPAAQDYPSRSAPKFGTAVKRNRTKPGMPGWMTTPNRDTGGIPAAQVRSVQWLARVLEYPDARRAEV